MPTQSTDAKGVAATARRIAAALRKLPDTIQEIRGADPWPPVEEAWQRLNPVLTSVKTDSEAMLRYIGRNWTPTHEAKLRRELWLFASNCTQSVHQMSYYEQRRETPADYQRRVSPALRNESSLLAKKLEEWADDIESKAHSEQTPATPDVAAMSREARALAVLTEHPDWTDKQIAEAAGVNRTTLYTYSRFKQARAVLQSDKPRATDRRRRKDEIAKARKRQSDT